MQGLFFALSICFNNIILSFIERPSMIPILYLNEAQKPISVYEDSIQLDSYDWKRIGIKSLTSNIDQTDRRETANSWKLRKIDFERFRN